MNNRNVPMPPQAYEDFCALVAQIDTLKGSPSGDSPDVRTAVRTIGAQMRTTLTAYGLWTEVPASHRAAILHTIAKGRDWADEGLFAKAIAAEETHNPPELDGLILLATYTAGCCNPEYRTFGAASDLKREFELSLTLADRLTRLPAGFQAEVIRPHLSDLVLSISTMQLEINFLPSRHGIDAKKEAASSLMPDAEG